MAYASWSVVFGEQPSAAKWNIIGTNMAGFNDGTAIGNAAISASKLATGAAAAVVATSETTTSTSYADLTTTTDTVTVTVGANGLLLVGIYATGSNSGADAQTYTSFALSSANTLAASDINAVLLRQTTATAAQAAGITKLLTGLTPGSTVVKMKYRVTGNTGTWLNRNIFAIPL